MLLFLTVLIGYQIKGNCKKKSIYFVGVGIKIGSEKGLLQSELLVSTNLKPCFIFSPCEVVKVN